jgi:TolA-binding protein
MVKNLMLRFLTCSLLVVSFGALGAFAQTSGVTEMGFTELVAGAEAAVKAGEPAKAVPMLKEIISRAGSIDNEEARENVQMARLRLAIALADLKKNTESRQYVEEYLAKLPRNEPELAMRVLCQLDSAAGNWEELYETASRLINDPKIGIRHKSAAKGYQAQALFEMGEYERALEMLPDAIKNAEDEQAAQSFRTMQLRALFETGQIVEGIETLSSFFRGETRYDPILNLTLLKMGDKLFESQRYNEARVIYGKITPRAELLARLNSRIQAIQDENAARTQWNEGDARRLLTLKNQAEQLTEIPNYSVYVSFRVAQIFAEQTRYWEAAALFDRLYQNSPDSNEGNNAFLQRIMLLFELDQDEEAIATAKDYIQQNRSELYTRMVCIQLMQHYLSSKQYEEALALVPYMDGWKPTNDPDVLDQETTLRYMVAFIHFEMGRYEEAYSAFGRVVQMNPQSQAGMDSGYWQAMCELLQTKYQAAYDAFVAYRESWPRASFAPAALFRSGVCQFGLENYAAARKAFQEFVDSYPSDALMPEALTMLADLQAADGEIDQAVANYRRAIDIVRSNYERQTDPELKKQIVLPATYAMIQAAQALQADADVYREEKEYVTATVKLNEIIRLVTDYLNTFKADSAVAQAVFWVGKAQIQLGQVDQAVSSYLDAVVRFGQEPEAEGVANILFDLAGIIERKLPGDRREDVLARIRDERERASTPALRIRLDVLLAELDGTTDELGRNLLAQEDNLDLVPPSGLSLMCGALLENKDYSRSREFYDHFLKAHEGSVFMKNAFRLRSEDLYHQNDLDQALELAEETLSLYGGAPGTGWAQIMKGRIQADREQYDEAIKTFKAVFSVGPWRNEAVAEATYRMADAYFLKEDYRKAFAFYQRTYLIYKTADGGAWAAEAYLRSAECLKALGREPAARNTYRAMLLDDYVKDSPLAETAREALGPQEVAELMSSGTNAMETVDAEGTL